MSRRQQTKRQQPCPRQEGNASCPSPLRKATRRSGRGLKDPPLTVSEKGLPHPESSKKTENNEKETKPMEKNDQRGSKRGSHTKDSLSLTAHALVTGKRMVSSDSGELGILRWTSYSRSNDGTETMPLEETVETGSEEISLPKLSSDDISLIASALVARKQIIMSDNGQVLVSKVSTNPTMEGKSLYDLSAWAAVSQVVREEAFRSITPNYDKDKICAFERFMHVAQKNKKFHSLIEAIPDPDNGEGSKVLVLRLFLLLRGTETLPKLDMLNSLMVEYIMNLRTEGHQVVTEDLENPKYIYEHETTLRSVHHVFDILHADGVSLDASDSLKGGLGSYFDYLKAIRNDKPMGRPPAGCPVSVLVDDEEATNFRAEPPLRPFETGQYEDLLMMTFYKVCRETSFSSQELRLVCVSDIQLVDCLKETSDSLDGLPAIILPDNADKEISKNNNVSNVIVEKKEEEWSTYKLLRHYMDVALSPGWTGLLFLRAAPQHILQSRLKGSNHLGWTEMTECCSKNTESPMVKQCCGRLGLDFPSENIKRLVLRCDFSTSGSVTGESFFTETQKSSSDDSKTGTSNIVNEEVMNNTIRAAMACWYHPPQSPAHTSRELSSRHIQNSIATSPSCHRQHRTTKQSRKKNRPPMNSRKTLHKDKRSTMNSKTPSQNDNRPPVSSKGKSEKDKNRSPVSHKENRPPAHSTEQNPHSLPSQPLYSVGPSQVSTGPYVPVMEHPSYPSYYPRASRELQQATYFPDSSRLHTYPVIPGNGNWQQPFPATPYYHGFVHSQSGQVHGGFQSGPVYPGLHGGGSIYSYGYNVGYDHNLYHSYYHN